jgi:uncharacterized protein
MSAFVIDAFEFCRQRGQREGVLPVAQLTRLAAECADPSGELAWSVRGDISPQGFPQLTLSVSAQVNLVCQRCLAPFAYRIESNSVLMLGESEAHADEIEEILDDDSIDVIVGSRTCDLLNLVEDEALLALPQAPKHEVCPDTTLLDGLKTEKPSPFEALKALKRG